SVAELLTVSGFKPHELTQLVVATPAATPPASPAEKFRHLAPWFDYDQLATTATPPQPVERFARLSRALAMLGCHSRMAGTVLGGRVMGKVNINAIWDKETLQAVCDA